MKEVIIIGTMHNMFPKCKSEFRSILEKINPDQILVEIDKKDLGSDEMDSYPKEILFAYKWAIENKKQVNAFDVDMDLWRKGISQKDEDKVEKDWFQKYGGKDWKFFNKETSNKRCEVWTIDKIINQNKMKTRQGIMLKNIRRMSANKGRILILTGAYHLDFFEKHMKDAIFPYR